MGKENKKENCKDGHILESLDNIDFPKVYDTPPYSLTVPADKVKEINFPKPSGKIFWNKLI